MASGDHLIGNKSGNNLALPTAKQPSSESKKKGWAEKREKEEFVKFLAELLTTVDDQDGNEVQLTRQQHYFYKLSTKTMEILNKKDIGQMDLRFVEYAARVLGYDDTKAAANTESFIKELVFRTVVEVPEHLEHLKNGGFR